MGQYIKFKDEEVKIGTCESCYYVTFDQMKQLTETGQLKDCGDGDGDSYIKLDSGYRFRFPFPDEKNIQPFSFSDPDKGFLIQIPKSLGIEIGHSEMFRRLGFKDSNTPHYLEFGVNLPCVQDTEQKNVNFRKWNFQDSLIFEVVQQKYCTQEGKAILSTCVRCPYCGSVSRLSEEEANLLYGYFYGLSKQSESNKEYYKETLEICSIIVQGYNINN